LQSTRFIFGGPNFRLKLRLV